MRQELTDGASRLESIHCGHAKAQDKDVWSLLLNLTDCIPTVACLRANPPGMFFNHFAQSRSQRLAVIGNENLSQ